MAEATYIYIYIYTYIYIWEHTYKLFLSLSLSVYLFIYLYMYIWKALLYVSRLVATGLPQGKPELRTLKAFVGEFRTRL